MTDIARRRADRLRVMNAIYEAAEGSRMSHVSGGWLLEHLGLSDEELGGICRYLEGEHLITVGREYWGHHTPFMILLTHAGIEEMKRSREAPDQATEHFPPISVSHIEGDAIGSAIQPGSLRAHQAVFVSHLNLDKVREIVGEFEGQAAPLPLPDGDTRQLRADMAAVKVQLDLPTPDHHTIRGHLQSAHAILEHATDRTAAACLICFATCSFERTKRLIATRVHDRPGRRGAGHRRGRRRSNSHYQLGKPGRPGWLDGTLIAPGPRPRCRHGHGCCSSVTIVSISRRMTGARAGCA